MKIAIDLTETIEKNAAIYFEKAKKAKKKLEGATETVERTKKKLQKLKKPVLKEKKVAKKKEWFEKFRWFYTSLGFLVIGGRDATTNEIVVKKHTDKDDLVFHTDMAGSPFFILKTGGKKPDKKTIKEVADATATFSKAWKLGLQEQKVFYVNPDQVTKKAKAGEYLTKGSFMIYGKTNYVENHVDLCVGVKDDMVMAGPCDAVKKFSKSVVELLQGKEKASSVAKKIQHKLGGELDDIIRVLPGGEFELK